VTLFEERMGVIDEQAIEARLREASRMSDRSADKRLESKIDLSAAARPHG
jgi:hypothetical protein